MLKLDDINKDALIKGIQLDEVVRVVITERVEDGAVTDELYAAEVVDQATASETIPELEAEIVILQDLERQALQVVQSGNDKKREPLFYIRNPFNAEPDFGVASINYDLSNLLSKSTAPEEPL